MSIGWLLIPRFESQERYLALSAVLGLLLALAAWATRGYVSVGFVAALGFANAMMWPAFAVLKQHYDFQLVFAALAIPCYLVILYYAVAGHRAGKA